MTTADGEEHVFCEGNLRFKTDSSEEGSGKGAPAIVGAGMMGDRASVIFRGAGRDQPRRSSQVAEPHAVGRLESGSVSSSGAVIGRDGQMGLYSKWILPPLLQLAMGQKDLRAYRQRVVPAARGWILEIGIGSGLNLPYYGRDVTGVIGIDPSPELLRMAEAKARSAAFPVELVNRSAEEIPLADASVDTVVMTWTLCSIPNPAAALREMRRVLKPTGALLFAEHGLSPDPGVAAWQHRLTPLWKRIGGGCHLDRDIDDLVRSAGWELDALETGYMRRGPRPMTFMYEGRARADGRERSAATPSSTNQRPHHA